GITHVTELLGTVLNIRTPSGTLVVEVDDPGISVTIADGGDQVVFTGPGFHEVRLRPGQHAVKATKDGATADEDLVTITQGGKQVVKVTRTGEFAAKSLPVVPLATLRGHNGGVNAVAFAPSDGNRLATASYDRTVKIWDRTKREAAITLVDH